MPTHFRIDLTEAECRALQIAVGRHQNDRVLLDGAAALRASSKISRALVEKGREPWPGAPDPMPPKTR